MKDAAVQTKADRSHDTASNQPAAGPAAVSAVPPGYGIDFLDRPQPNRTGLPDRLKAGVEALSGLSMDDVRVHYNSSKPMQLQALAYTQGTEIHVGPGQEKHLPHEAWHVVQQKQGRVMPTVMLKGSVPVNDEEGLEREADRMGLMAAAQRVSKSIGSGPFDDAVADKPIHPNPSSMAEGHSAVVQRRVGYEFEMGWMIKAPGNTVGMHTAVINGGHWHVVPDMKPLPPEMEDERHYTGYGNLEFVTDAFEETPAGRFNLNFAMVQIENLVNQIAKSWYGFTGWGDVKLTDFVNNGINWGASTPNARRDDIWIDRQNDATGLASPQMTAGVKLERVTNVLAEMGQTTPVGQPDLYGRAPSPQGQALHPSRAIIDTVTNRAGVQTALSLAGTHLTASQQSEYTGAVAHLGLIVALGQRVDVGTNEKYLSAFLSRTNFGDLPDYIRTKVHLKKDVMVAAGLANNADSYWTIRGAAQGTALFSASPNMAQTSIYEWLDGIAGGHDPFRWGQEGDLTRWSPQQVGPQGNQGLGHVYEFRGVSGQKPVREWRAWALDLFDRVMNVINV